MRHRKVRRKMGGRTGVHQRAMYANMLTSLVEHGRIKTTDRKARELRGVAERAISRATSLGDVLLKEAKELSQVERAQLVHAMRMVRRVVRDREATQKIFREWAPKYISRPGGYTRVLKLGYRQGDRAAVSLIEFVEGEIPDVAPVDGDEGETKASGATKTTAKKTTAKKAKKTEPSASDAG